MEFQATHPDTSKESYIFNVDDPTEPDLTLQPPSFLVSCEYNPKDPNIIAGGCYNGQVCALFKAHFLLYDLTFTLNIQVSCQLFLMIISLFMTCLFHTF